MYYGFFQNITKNKLCMTGWTAQMDMKLLCSAKSKVTVIICGNLIVWKAMDDNVPY